MRLDLDESSGSLSPSCKAFACLAFLALDPLQGSAAARVHRTKKKKMPAVALVVSIFAVGEGVEKGAKGLVPGAYRRRALSLLNLPVLNAGVTLPIGNPLRILSGSP